MADARVHATGYAYKSPVTASYNEARLTPRSDSGRTSSSTASKPFHHPKLSLRRLLGNRGDGVRPARPAHEWRSRPPSVVETDKSEPPAKTITFEGLAAEGVRDRFDEMLTPTHYTPASRRLERVGRRIIKENPNPTTPFNAAASGGRNAELRYVPGTTGVHSSGLCALREGKGVCQDFAHLSLIHVGGMGESPPAMSRDTCIRTVRRSWGHRRRTEPRLDPGLDGRLVNHTRPTTARSTSSNISVGVGRDYGDVPPLKGIYPEEGSTDLTWSRSPAWP